MEIAEIKKIKAETEQAILQLLRDFKDKTNLSVSDIRFIYATQMGMANMHSPVSVELTVFI